MNTRPQILITREPSDAARFVDMLAGVHADIQLLPFFEVVQLSPTQPEPAEVDALLVTSSHAIPFLATQHELKQKPCLVVGEYTRNCLFNTQFNKIMHTAGNAQEMLELLKRQTSALRLLYVRGERVSLDFKSMLQPTNVSVAETIVYRMNPLSPDANELPRAFQSGVEFFLPLFSEQTAIHVCNEIAASTASAFSCITAITMSPHIAEAIKSYGFKIIEISDSADLQSIADKVMLLTNS